jgi:hypothetical protein
MSLDEAGRRSSPGTNVRRPLPSAATHIAAALLQGPSSRPCRTARLVGSLRSSAAAATPVTCRASARCWSALSRAPESGSHSSATDPSSR